MIRSITILFFLGIVFGFTLKTKDFSSPEMTAQTFFTALEEHNLELMSDCIHPESQYWQFKQVKDKKLSLQQIEELQKTYGTFYDVGESSTVTSGSKKGYLRLPIHLVKDTGETNEIIAYFKEMNGLYLFITL